MKLLQWNIWYQEKIENIAKLIQELDPDILCLQELTADSHYNSGIHTAEYLRDLLGMRMFYKDAQLWKNKTSDKIEMGNGIFSKFPIASGEYTVVHPATDSPESSPYQGRIYLEANLKINGMYLTVGTTHLNGTPAFVEMPVKEQEAGALAKQLKKNTSRFIFTGDFNALPDSSTVKSVSEILHHVGPDFAEPTWTTKPYQSPNFQTDELKYRLDYVFTTPDIYVSSSEIIKTSYSDHLPILIQFDFL